MSLSSSDISVWKSRSKIWSIILFELPRTRVGPVGSHSSPRAANLSTDSSATSAGYISVMSILHSQAMCFRHSLCLPIALQHVKLRRKVSDPRTISVTEMLPGTSVIALSSKNISRLALLGTTSIIEYRVVIQQSIAAWWRTNYASYLQPRFRHHHSKPDTIENGIHLAFTLLGALFPVDFLSRKRSSVHFSHESRGDSLESR